jgi:hypothetical protein
MNYATDYTVILTALYILIVAIAFSPKTCKVEPVEKIEYFPEIEAVELAPEIPLTALGIRELKKLASKAKIKRYSSLNKQQLILALT